MAGSAIKNQIENAAMQRALSKSKLINSTDLFEKKPTPEQYDSIARKESENRRYNNNIRKSAEAQMRAIRGGGPVSEKGIATVDDDGTYLGVTAKRPDVSKSNNDYEGASSSEGVYKKDKNENPVAVASSEESKSKPTARKAAPIKRVKAPVIDFGALADKGYIKLDEGSAAPLGETNAQADKLANPNSTEELAPMAQAKTTEERVGEALAQRTPSLKEETPAAPSGDTTRESAKLDDGLADLFSRMKATDEQKEAILGYLNQYNNKG